MFKTIKNFIIIFFIGLPFLSIAQVKVTGTVRDSNSSVESANVVFVKKSSFKGTTTTKTGTFSIDLNKGDYTLTVSFMGYKDYTKTVSITKDLNLNNILLEKDDIALKHVVIKAKKRVIERKRGKLFFNVEHSYLKNGYDGVEVLKRIPSVFVSNNGGISMRNESATVFINGRRLKLSGDALTDYLSNINSDIIKKVVVEQMTSSETDANIQGGTINFVLKKPLVGFSRGGVYSYKQLGDYSKRLGQVRFNYGAKKWNFYGSIYYKDSQYISNTESSTIYTNQNKRFDEDSRAFFNLHNKKIVRFGVNFLPVKNHELGLEFLTSKNKIGAETNSFLSVTESNILTIKGITDDYDRLNKAYDNASINYTIKLDESGGKLKFLGDYSLSKSNQSANATTSYNLGDLDGNSEKYKTDSDSKLITAQLDYSKNIKSIGKFNFGVKYGAIDRENYTKVKKLEGTNFVVDLSRTSKFNFKENIYATYFSISNTFLEKYHYKIGLRVENLDIEGEEIVNNTTISKNYTDYFPSFYLSQDLKNKNSISFSYNRKLKRPSFHVLNPYINKVNDFYFMIGNPNLQPEYRSNFDFTYAFKKSSLAVYNNHTTNLMLESSFIKEGVTYYQSKNDGNSNVIGIDFNYSKKWSKKWYLKTNLNLYNYDYNLFEKNFNHNTFSINVVNDFKLPKNWLINFKTRYSTSRLEGNYLMGDEFVANFMVQKILLKKKLRVRLYFNDIFNTVRSKDMAEFSNVETQFYRKRDTQTFTFLVSYSVRSKERVRRSKNKTSKNSRLN